MQAPVDYPIVDHAHHAQFSVDELTYATLLDRMDRLASDNDQMFPEAPVFTPQEAERATAGDRQLLRPITVFAQTLLARDYSRLTVPGGGSGETCGVFSRWSRARR